MSNKAARNLFIYGSLFFFVIFLALTYDTLGKLADRAPVISDQVNNGKHTWQKYDCIGCHTIFGNGSYFAPDLTKTTQNKPKEYLIQFLMNPKGVKATAAMPTFGITKQEAEDLYAFLDWTSKVNTNDWPPKPILAVSAGVSGQDLSAGQKLYQSLHCTACHTLNGIGGTTGPDLTKVGSRRDRDWLFGHFKDPGKYTPGSVMPMVSAPDADINELTDYMMTLK
jgi:nitric oxide reductase subunit C